MNAEKKLKLEPTTQADHTGDAILTNLPATWKL